MSEGPMLLTFCTKLRLMLTAMLAWRKWQAWNPPQQWFKWVLKHVPTRIFKHVVTVPMAAWAKWPAWKKAAQRECILAYLGELIRTLSPHQYLHGKVLWHCGKLGSLPNCTLILHEPRLECLQHHSTAEWINWINLARNLWQLGMPGSHATRCDGLVAIDVCLCSVPRWLESFAYLNPRLTICAKGPHHAHLPYHLRCRCASAASAILVW